MKAVAASRLRKAQDQMLGARPFAHQIHRVLSGLASQVDTSAHPLLTQRAADAPERPTLLVVVTADKGLCGSFNTNILKEAGTVITTSGSRQVTLGLVGRKGRDFFGKRGFDVRFELVNIFNHLTYSHAEAIAREAIAAYTGGEVHSVQLVYNEFKSAMTQEVVVEQLLPIVPATYDAGANATDFIYEPSREAVMDAVLPRHLTVQIFRMLLESQASEMGARMSAMDSATKNAGDLIDRLTLQYNRARQANITAELMEIISGAEAIS